MTITPETTPDAPPTPEQLLVDLGELHTRTCVSHLPKHPAAMGWQATAGSMAAGFARALYALNEVAPTKAAEIAEWFQGPFADGPDPEEHTDWLERHVARGPELLEQWVEDGRRMAQEALKNTQAWEEKNGNAPADEDRQDVHTYFSLSYANYLVLPRTLLQSMPDAWQARFVALVNELHDAFEHVKQAPTYQVTAGKTMQLDEMTESELSAAGIIVEGDGPDGPGPETRYHRGSDGAELTGQDYGFVPGKDPVPHYDRGRARVEPRLGGGV